MPLSGFHPAVAEWFESTFTTPTEPQRLGWPQPQIRAATVRERSSPVRSYHDGSEVSQTAIGSPWPRTTYSIAARTCCGFHK